MVAPLSIPDLIAANHPLPSPDPHMQDLAWFIGSWVMHSRTLTDPAADTWLEETLRAEHTLEMGGHIIFEHFFGPMGGSPLEAWSLRKYNHTSGKWEQCWTDTGSGGFVNWIGLWQPATDTGRLTGMYIGYAGRFVDADLNLTGTTGLREIFDHIEADRFSWRLEQTKDGGSTWKIIWTLEYTRQLPE